MKMFHNENKPCELHLWWLSWQHYLQARGYSPPYSGLYGEAPPERTNNYVPPYWRRRGTTRLLPSNFTMPLFSNLFEGDPFLVVNLSLSQSIDCLSCMLHGQPKSVSFQWCMYFTILKWSACTQPILGHFRNIVSNLVLYVQMTMTR